MAAVSLKQIAATISEKHSMSKKDTTELLDGFIAELVKNIKKGEKVRIPGLGMFSVAKRAARMGRNPQTGEPIKIKASKKVRYRVAKDLKEAI
jgi:DNA-binding protein HU-beta